MVTLVPVTPLDGLRVVSDGVKVKTTELLALPFTVTTTLPVPAPVGTGAVMLVALQELGVAVTPLNVTVLVPFVAPKLVPVTVTPVPTPPEMGDSEEMPGDTVNATALLATPPTVTITLPPVAPAGTGTVMLLALQAVGVAAV